ncbi:unnamed protein product [Polarella glacialis]|uniref:Uncharacterized protein n=1 Tax=Polarella glacialis TaxID=89957 RepID=A0A813LMB3_POLGL|nr:unnamed protein product [Polarella glacialis]CAE8735925.1 unnamed protein product [Polarella glacialis]|mmetsp:Transcript_75255/g.121505  ORF Transcript_75255/g.121505 Transcript_75255/m.121505 type:complete len:341 (+) Transcript_75255:77-1099(+)
MSKVQVGTSPNSMSGGIAALPPQVCPLALGLAGLGGLLTHWARIQGTDLTPLPLAFALVAATLLAAYAAKVLLVPSAVWKDASDPGPLAALSGGPAAIQALAVRFGWLLGPFLTQSTLLACLSLSLVISCRFAVLCFRKGVLPDATWFPALLLSGMSVVTVSAAGPAWLQSYMPGLFWSLMVLYYPLKAIVAYRMLFSANRLAILPNAGMNLLMAPASFFTVAHLSSGKPGGDAMGLVLFMDSTVFCLATLRMLYVRRASWAHSFHPSYVAFTFPAASTATAAVLAAERLPLISGPLLWAWATLLAAVVTCVIFSVLVRFIWFLSGVTAVVPISKEEKQQ